MVSTLGLLFIFAFLKGCAAQGISAPEKTDLVMVIQTSLCQAGYDYVTNSIQQILYNYVQEYMRGGNPSTVRIAVVGYSDTAHVWVDLYDGYNLQNTDELEAWISKTKPYDATSTGSDLSSALLKCHDLLFQQSYPSHTQILLVVTDGSDHVMSTDLQQSVDLIHMYYRSPVVLGIGDFALDDEWLSGLVKNNTHNMYVANVCSTPSSGERALVPALDIDIWDWAFVKVCRITHTICSKTCGIGSMMVNAKCTIYVHGEFYLVVELTYLAPCCDEPCFSGGQHGGGVLCRDVDVDLL